MKIAHFSDIHITASLSAIPWRAMLSKRIGQGRRVEMHELYDEIADQVATVKARALPRRRGRVVLPPRPEKQAD